MYDQYNPWLADIVQQYLMTIETNDNSEAAQVGTEQPSPGTWFLGDGPLEDLSTTDAFEHRTYGDVLHRTISEVEPPFTIGVYGQWGIGKTSVAKDVQQRFNTGRTTKRDPFCVLIDVWQFEADSLRRQILVDLRRQLSEPEPKILVEKGDEFRRLDVGVATDTPTSRFRRPTLTALFILLGTVLGAAGLTFVLSLLLDKANLSTVFGVESKTELTALGAAIALTIVPTYALLLPQVSRLFVESRREILTSPEYYSPEQFADLFHRIVCASTCSKLIIIFDNLDRCSHEHVLETLSTIKTFLEPASDKCVFMIPCDDEAIKQHIESDYQRFGGGAEAKQRAEEYLRKFFNAAIRIDPFTDEQVIGYVKAQLTNMRAIQELRLNEEIEQPQWEDQFAELVAGAFKTNPRQMKQFLNLWTGKYLIAQSRETRTPPQIYPPLVTDDPLFLLKVSILETKHPEHFKSFSRDNSLFVYMLDAVIRGSIDGERMAEAHDVWSDPELMLFLNKTISIAAENPAAFLKLKQNNRESTIKGYPGFVTAIENGDEESVVAAVSGAPEQHRDDYLQEIYSRVEASADARLLLQMAMSLAVAGAVVRVPGLDRDKVRGFARGVANIATRPLVNSVFGFVNQPGRVLDLAAAAGEESRQTITKALIETTGQSSDPKRIEAVLSALVDKATHLTPTEVARIQELSLSISIDGSTFFPLVTTPEVTKQLVSTALVSRQIEFLRLGAEPLTNEPPAVTFIIRALMVGSADDIRRWLEALRAYSANLQRSNTDQFQLYAGWVNRTVDVLASLGVLSEVDTVVIEVISASLEGGLARYGQAVRGDAAWGIWRLASVVNDPSSRHELVIKRLVDDEDWENTLRFRNRAGISIPSDEGWTEYDKRLVQRIYASYVAGEIQEVTDALKAHLDPPNIVKLVEVATTGSRTDIAEVILTNCWEAVRVVPNVYFQRILSAALHVEGPLTEVEQRSHLINIAKLLKTKWSSTYETVLVRHLGEMSADPVDGQRALAIGTATAWVDSEIISEEMEARVLHKALGALKEREGTSFGDSDYTILSETAAFNWPGRIVRDYRETLANILIGQLEAEGLTDAERLDAAGRLSALADTPAVLTAEMVLRLTVAATTGLHSDRPAVVDAIETTLLALMPRNNPEESVLWEPWDHYLRNDRRSHHAEVAASLITKTKSVRFKNTRRINAEAQATSSGELPS